MSLPETLPDMSDVPIESRPSGAWTFGGSVPLSVGDLGELLSFLDDLLSIDSVADIESVALPGIAILLRATPVIYSTVHVTGSVRVRSYWPHDTDSGRDDDTWVAVAAAELLMGRIDETASTESAHRRSNAVSQIGVESAAVCGRPNQMAMVVRVSPVRVETLSMVCKDGRFGQRERELATRLTPHLGAAISRVHRRSQLDSESSPVPVAHQLSAAGLSPRELEVMKLASEGMTAAQVARRFGISPRTVDKHLENVYRKLAVTSRNAAAERLSADTAWNWS